MENLGNYFLWTSVYMAIVGLVYFFAVRRLASPSQCRWFIIIGFLASLVFGAFGLVSFQRSAEAVTSYTMIMPEFVLDTSAAIENTGRELFYAISTQRLLAYFSIGVSMLLAIRLITSIVFLTARISIDKKFKKHGCIVVPMHKNITPFSFFRYVFIPESMLNNENIHPVLIHEQAHMRKRHSYDLIFIELLTLVFWFHPAIWYLRRELKLQHEFDADRFVLQQKVEKRSYQQILLNMSFSGLRYAIANPFNYSPIKKRIIMMNRNFKTSHAKAILSMLAVIPLFVIVFVLQSCEQKHEPGSEQKQDLAIDPKDELISDTVYSVVDKNPSFPGGTESLYAFLRENLRYPEEDRREGNQGTVFVSFVVKANGKIADIDIVRGVSPGIDSETLRVMHLMPDWEPGKLDGEAVNVQYNLPVRFGLE